MRLFLLLLLHALLIAEDQSTNQKLIEHCRYVLATEIELLKPRDKLLGSSPDSNSIRLSGLEILTGYYNGLDSKNGEIDDDAVRTSFLLAYKGVVRMNSFLGENFKIDDESVPAHIRESWLNYRACLKLAGRYLDGINEDSEKREVEEIVEVEKVDNKGQ